eukprot:209791-Chlamydomonas_euryale.AAC.2
MTRDVQKENTNRFLNKTNSRRTRRGDSSRGCSGKTVQRGVLRKRSRCAGVGREIWGFIPPPCPRTSQSQIPTPLAAPPALPLLPADPPPLRASRRPGQRPSRAAARHHPASGV